MRFDLLIKGGNIIDPGAGYNGIMDIAVNRNRIAAVEPEIPAKSAFQVIDAAGQYVAPGFIDMHTHIYKDVTFWGIDADSVGSQTGVTTWVDAGSAGAMTLDGFRAHVIEPSVMEILAYINITYIGLIGWNYELSNNEYCNVEILERVVNLNRDIVAGIKLRAGRGGGALDLVPFHRARKAADDLELPIMVHISMTPPDLATVLDFLKPGDIVTHSFTGQNMRIVDEKGKLLDVAKKVWDEGVIMDLGHGAGSFSFEVAESLADQGYWPDVISTDLHWLSIFGQNLVGLPDVNPSGDLSAGSDAGSVIAKVKGECKPVFTMLTCMDKMLYLGMPLPDVITAATSRPAEILGLKGEKGTLKPGTLADIAVFTIDNGDFELWDVHGNMRRGKKRVRNILTIAGGRVLKPLEIPDPPPWVEFVE